MTTNAGCAEYGTTRPENDWQVPLVCTVFSCEQIIHQLYPQYNWIAILIEMFITISITVSYLTVGAAMHHTRQSLICFSVSYLFMIRGLLSATPF